MKRRRPPRPKPVGRTKPGVGAPPLTALDEFSEQSLAAWFRAARNLRDLHSALHFGLEEQRQREPTALAAAIQAGADGPFAFEGWSRIVDYRYSLTPLSVRGSLTEDGGRFNIGAGLNPASFTPFPALYVGQNYATAFAEKFGSIPTDAISELSAADLALRSPSSFTHVALRGRVELILDASKPAALAPFVRIIQKFHIPFGAMQTARKFGGKPPGLIRSTETLMAQLADPDWLKAPMQFDLPSNSQVFGRIAAAAGLHGILYPSARAAGKRCLALFPQNWGGSESFIEIADGSPLETKVARIDGSCTSID